MMRMHWQKPASDSESPTQWEWLTQSVSQQPDLIAKIQLTVSRFPGAPSEAPPDRQARGNTAEFAESRSRDSRLCDSAKMSDTPLGDSETRASSGPWITCGLTAAVLNHLHYPKQASWVQVRQRRESLPPFCLMSKYIPAYQSVRLQAPAAWLGSWSAWGLADSESEARRHGLGGDEPGLSPQAREKGAALRLGATVPRAWPGPCACATPDLVLCYAPAESPKQCRALLHSCASLCCVHVSK